ncbi:MAG: tetratricopeptide repeat protein [Pseudomonadota bacterium]
MPARGFQDTFGRAHRAFAAGDFRLARDRYRRGWKQAASVAEQFAALLGAGRACLGLGNFGEALQYLDAALELCTPEASAPDVAVATAHHATAQALLGLGRLREAHRHVGRALARRVSALGEGHRATLSSLSLLGVLHHRLGHLHRAGTLQRQCLQLRRASLGPDDPDVTASLQALAQVHFARERFKQALQLHQQALRQVLARREDRPGLQQRLHEAAAWNAVGQALHRDGQHEAAEWHFARAEAEFLDCLGAQHPQTASVWQNLAALHLHRAPRRSLAWGRKALRVLRKTLGDEHLETAAAEVLVANCLYRCGQFKAAHETLLRAIAVQERQLSERHPELRKTRRLAVEIASAASSHLP